MCVCSFSPGYFICFVFIGFLTDKNLPGKVLRLFRSQGMRDTKFRFWVSIHFFKLFHPVTAENFGYSPLIRRDRIGTRSMLLRQIAVANVPGHVAPCLSSQMRRIIHLVIRRLLFALMKLFP